MDPDFWRYSVETGMRLVLLLPIDSFLGGEWLSPLDCLLLLVVT